MIRSVVATLFTLVMMGVPVHADLVTGTLTGDSILTPSLVPGVYVQNFTGDGDDTIFGAFTLQSQSTTDFNNPPSIVVTGGSFVETFSQGTLFGTSSGGGTGSGHGTATVTLDLVVTGGTGLFAGDTGEATATETITNISGPVESVNGSYSGSIGTVPEPGLLPPLAAATIILFCRRRHRAMAG